MGNGTSIGRVRGLGSAKTGAHHWLVQRFTAIGNLLLVLWLAVSILLLPDMSYASVSEWLSTPVPATAMALLVVSTFWHARIGLQVVVEDYVHEHANKFACIAALNLAAFAGAAFGVFCVVRLALGAHA
ncbi:succinate dehydrogenase, hydrophobic membrane anchor protein [Novosphingobium pentaromativorans]|uniref:Succinate dehydrogenase hydrophobic membrane anchor subunit n=1 Tax=Novosphingobium pentaromativorans US6-1 TaxID=1088721 RepID=G6EHN4_9SPHN|nr:succinate dehydrogenase, hydrophobic membrane anchor protein [Novosphingobium pentaromativorans]AIT78531.1 succinate dehydrogenase [Novosphingobium pentaromativorans US6-1]EHJ59194.1 succinate dehydrogenase hydrophobic membrane anchor protein [Novosphingobium pentaromativorans US6-1]